MRKRERAAAATGAALAGVVAFDLVQRRHAILRNFPIIGHLRYILEEVGPELRQYIVTSNNEERPFSRDQRGWVYASSKRQINTIGFGSDNEMENVSNYLIIKQAARPFPRAAVDEAGRVPVHPVPCGKVLGAAPAAAGVPAGVRREHQRHELRRAVGERRPGDESRRAPGRVPAEHGRGRPLRPPSPAAVS